MKTTGENPITSLIGCFFLDPDRGHVIIAIKPRDTLISVLFLSP